MGIYYLGAFPPSYGGVTIKNENLYQALSAKIEIEKIDFNLIKRRDIKEIVRCLKVIFNRKNRFVIGVAGKGTRKRFTQLLYYCNRKAMNNSIIFLMGGTAANDIVSDQKYLEYAAGYKKIYAETKSMIKTLENAGLRNAGYYPNGRFKPKNKSAIEKRKGCLKCVFFSAIQPEKGVDIILTAAKKMPEIQFAFYGYIDPKYQSKFDEKIIKTKNVKYYGVFMGRGDEVYSELEKYDVLLFPTQWKIEGVPGILVEGKISGLAEIVSNESYNKELVKDYEEGIVLENNNSECLITALKKMDEDRTLLQKLKEGSAMSAKQFYIENYVENIIERIQIVDYE